MSHIYRRKIRHREISLGHPHEWNTYGLLDEEGVVAIGVLRLGTRQTHRHTRRHLENGIRNSPIAYDTTALLLLDLVVGVARKDRVSLAGMRYRTCEILVAHPRYIVLAA